VLVVVVEEQMPLPMLVAVVLEVEGRLLGG